jgi:hypothetical protein
MRRNRRRAVEEFGMSFLDVICCGFGSVILLLMITKTVAPQLLEQSQRDLDNQIAAREQQLYEIRGQIREQTRLFEESLRLLDTRLTALAAIERELSRIRGQFSTTTEEREESLAATQQLAAARQSLTDEMQRLLGADFRRDTGLVGGIAVDSEYIIFVIDTSGSMFNVAWPVVLRKVEETLAIYPRVKGIQVMSDEGEFMFSQFRDQWIPDTPARRKAISERLRSWNVFSNSSPVEGIEAAIRTFHDPDKLVSIYVFGDDFTGDTIRTVLDEVDRLNALDASGRRRVRIHAIGFPVYLDRPSERIYRFAALMRELAYRNDGTFVGLSELQ